MTDIKIIADYIIKFEKMSLWGCEELYVTGLPADATEQELRGLFGAHGTVKEAVIVNKKVPSAPNAPQSCIVRQVCEACYEAG